MMEVREIFELRRQGRIEEAYEAIRPLYATDKGPYTSRCMFWTANDVLKKRVQENRKEEAVMIFRALLRLFPNLDDKEGIAQKALTQSAKLLSKEVEGFTIPTLQGTQASKTSHNRMSHNDLGRWGEEVAAQYLEGKGYQILERDWRSGHRDIDIIARNAQTVVFVEVKTRRTNDFGEPFEAVGYHKCRNLLAAINHYIKYKRLDLETRFDVISIVAQDLSNPAIQHIEDIQLI